MAIPIRKHFELKDDFWGIFWIIVCGILLLNISGCITMTKKNYEDQKSLSYTQGYVDGLFFCSGIKKK